MKTELTRRGLLLGGAALLAAAGEGRYRISLAAYSMRKYLDLKAPTMTLEQFIEKSAEWGVDGVELTEYYFKKPITAEYVMGLKRRAMRCGLDITGTPIGNSFTLPPGEKREAEIGRVNAWIDISADLGSPAIRIFAGSTPKETDDATARNWAIECIKACLDHAGKRGVILALENHGGVVATGDGMMAMVEAIKHEWFGVNLDTGNFHTADPYVDIERCAPHAVTCQVKVEISPAGKKAEPIDMARIVKIMRAAKYRGYLTLEYEAAEEPNEAIPRHLKALRESAL